MTPPTPHALVERLDAACRSLDDAAFDEAWHAAVVELGIGEAVRSVLLPYLHLLGDLWEAGTVSVAHEHFASGLVRQNLLRRLSGEGSPAGPCAVVACPPGERHDLGPLGFAVLLREAGWQVDFLGADTALAILSRTCQVTHPDLVVVSGTRSTVLEARTSALRRLDLDWQVVLAGAGAIADLSMTTGLTCLDPDVAVALEQVTGLVEQTAAG